MTLRQAGRGEPALPELGRDHRPDIVVLALAPAQFGVAPADECLDRLVEVVGDVGDDPDRGRLRQARRGRQVAYEVLRERVRHASFLLGPWHLGKIDARFRAQNGVIYRT
jgi:plasmid stabilization system protein ParE